MSSSKVSIHTLPTLALDHQTTFLFNTEASQNVINKEHNLTFSHNIDVSPSHYDQTHTARLSYADVFSTICDAATRKADHLDHTFQPYVPPLIVLPVQTRSQTLAQRVARHPPPDHDGSDSDAASSDSQDDCLIVRHSSVERRSRPSPDEVESESDESASDGDSIATSCSSSSEPVTRKSTRTQSFSRSTPSTKPRRGPPDFVLELYRLYCRHQRTAMPPTSHYQYAFESDLDVPTNPIDVEDTMPVPTGARVAFVRQYPRRASTGERENRLRDDAGGHEGRRRRFSFGDIQRSDNSFEEQLGLSEEETKRIFPRYLSLSDHYSEWIDSLPLREGLLSGGPMSEGERRDFILLYNGVMGIVHAIREERFIRELEERIRIRVAAGMELQEAVDDMEREDGGRANEDGGVIMDEQQATQDEADAEQRGDFDNELEDDDGEGLPPFRRFARILGEEYFMARFASADRARAAGRPV